MHIECMDIYSMSLNARVKMLLDLNPFNFLNLNSKFSPNKNQKFIFSLVVVGKRENKHET